MAKQEKCWVVWVSKGYRAQNLELVHPGGHAVALLQDTAGVVFPVCLKHGGCVLGASQCPV